MKRCGNCKHWKSYKLTKRKGTGSCEAPVPAYLTLRNENLIPMLDKSFIDDTCTIAERCESYRRAK